MIINVSPIRHGYWLNCPIGESADRVFVPRPQGERRREPLQWVINGDNSNTHLLDRTSATVRLAMSTDRSVSQLGLLNELLTAEEIIERAWTGVTAEADLETRLRPGRSVYGLGVIM